MNDDLISAEDLLDLIKSSQVRLEYVETKVSGTHESRSILIAGSGSSVFCG